MPAPRLNWHDIKAEYETGDDGVTMRTLAKKHGVGLKALGTRASKENWTNARTTHRQRVASEAVKRVQSEQVTLRAKQLRVYDAVLAKGLKTLQATEPKDFAEALKAVEVACEGSRKAAGIPDEHHHLIGFEVDWDALTREELERIAAGDSPGEVAPSKCTARKA